MIQRHPSSRERHPTSFPAIERANQSPGHLLPAQTLHVPALGHLERGERLAPPRRRRTRRRRRVLQPHALLRPARGRLRLGLVDASARTSALAPPSGRKGGQHSRHNVRGALQAPAARVEAARARVRVRACLGACTRW